jgi:hypothetical protein
MCSSKVVETYLSQPNWGVITAIVESGCSSLNSCREKLERRSPHGEGNLAPSAVFLIKIKWDSALIFQG